MNNYFRVSFLSALLIMGVSLNVCCSNRTNNDSNPGTTTFEQSDNNYVTTPYMPGKIDFAGEPLPLQYFDVRESLERELIVNMNFHSSTLQHLKKITRFFPVIEPILKEQGVPDDFKYLAVIESDLMNKVSPAGATGVWQFMKKSAEDYDLEVNSEIDERYHLEKSTIAACKYLKDSYKVYENWTMAAASYNMGRTGLSRQVNRQKCDNYYDLLLNEETQRYVFRIVAIKIILNNPEKFGFQVPEKEKYREIPYKEVKVKTSVEDWADFAFKYDTNYKLLKYMNPWLRDVKLSNPRSKTYTVKVPAKGFRKASHIDVDEAEKIEEETKSIQKHDIIE